MTETYTEFVFPLAGIDSSNEFWRQPPLTSRDAQNVRSFESLTQRGRGGSRPGITPYIPDQVAGDNPIQCLNFVTIITAEAVLEEDGVRGLGASTLGGSGGPSGSGGGDGGYAGPGPGLPPGPGPGGPDGSAGEGGTPPGGTPGPGFQYDDSTDNLRPRKPPGGRVIRKKGSGIRPHRKGKNGGGGGGKIPPVAHDDFGETTIGGLPISIIPIVNDTYLGTPTIVLGAIPDLLGGTLTTSGAGLTLTLYYSPAATGDGGTITIPYTLTATGNRGNSRANIIITVHPPPPPTPPGTYHVQVTRVRSDDGVAQLTIAEGSGFPTTELEFIDSLFSPGFIEALLGTLPAGTTAIIGPFVDFPLPNFNADIAISGPYGFGAYFGTIGGF